MLSVMIPQALFSNGMLINSLFLQQGKNVLKRALPHQHHLVEDGESSWEEDSVRIGAKIQQATGPSLDTSSRGGGSAVQLRDPSGEHTLLRKIAGSLKKRSPAFGRESLLWLSGTLLKLNDAGQMLFEEGPLMQGIWSQYILSPNELEITASKPGEGRGLTKMAE